jgi:hypothetical protein
MSGATQQETADRYAYWLTKHPQQVCDTFTARPAPAEWWCAGCGWSKPLHGDDTARQAIAAELARLARIEREAYGIDPAKGDA